MTKSILNKKKKRVRLCCVTNKKSVAYFIGKQNARSLRTITIKREGNQNNKNKKQKTKTIT